MTLLPKARKPLDDIIHNSGKGLSCGIFFAGYGRQTPSACGQTGPTHQKTIFSFEKLILLHVEIKSLCSFPDQIQMLPLSGHT